MAGVYGLAGGLAPRSLPPLSEPRLAAAAGVGASAGAANAAAPEGTQQDTAVFSDAARQAAAQEKQQPGKLDEKQQKEVERLKERDREVRQHEQAHAAAAGRYAKGGPRYEFTRGPDGRQYATGGEVSIDTSPASTPEATIAKMQQVRRAALAPAEPSPQDRRVAAEASAAEIKARQALVKARAAESGEDGRAPEAPEAAGGSEAPATAEGNAGAVPFAADAPVPSADPTGNALTRIINSFTGSGSAAAGRLDARA